MKICFLGLDNLPVLAKEFGDHVIGGEQVQQTLLARALVRRGVDVSMVVFDYGQDDGAEWDGIKTYRAYRERAGLPVIRFLHPRWTKVWAAMDRANADVYYVSCAGMQLGLAALYCRRYSRKLVFRVAHDTDCEPDKLLIKFWRDKKLYEFGLLRADGILVQTVHQQKRMAINYRQSSIIAEMLVDRPLGETSRSIDVLWVNNLRNFKRPDVFLALARLMPELNFVMIGGTQPGSEALYDAIKAESMDIPNLRFLGRVQYHDMDKYYAGAKIFVNTSDTEGFPNSYLQAWIRGTPVVSFFDPDDLIRRKRLGHAVSSLDEMRQKIGFLRNHEEIWLDTSRRCKIFMETQFGDDRIIGPYISILKEITNENR